MGPSLPRMLEDKKVIPLPSQYVSSRELKTPKVILSELFPMHSSHLLRFQKYPLPSKCYRSPLRRQTFRIAFHPQRVRRVNRKRIERVLLPMLLSDKPRNSEGLLSSVESKVLPRGEQAAIRVERPRAFCMFLSKQERREFFVPSRSVLQQKPSTPSPERDIEQRSVAPYRRVEDLVELGKLGFSGAITSPRREEHIRDFLEARSLFPGDDERRERIEKEATEFKPRMTFTR